MEDSVQFSDGKQIQMLQGPSPVNTYASQVVLYIGTLFFHVTMAWIPTKSTLVHHR